jgi:hypothetical protein
MVHKDATDKCICSAYCLLVSDYIERWVLLCISAVGLPLLALNIDAADEAGIWHAHFTKSHPAF